MIVAPLRRLLEHEGGHFLDRPRGGNAAILSVLTRDDFKADPLRVLIVDDDRIYGESLRAFLEADPRITVVDVVARFRPALGAAMIGDAELVLVDVHLSVDDSYAIVEALRNLRPELCVVMMSGLDASEFEERAIAAGASGAVGKSVFLERGRDFLISAYVRACDPYDAEAAG